MAGRKPGAGPDGRLLIAVFGPTSSGKTRLSVELARALMRASGREAVIISADSRQVYRYMDIGTSKTTPQQMHGVRHELLDVLEPVRKLELEEWAALARAQVDRCFATGAIPLLVGGTGVYVKALLDGWNVDAVGPVRESVRRDFPRAMAADAYQMLRRLDRDAAARVHPANYEAVINALASAMAPSPGPDRPAGPGRPGPGAAGQRQVLLGLDPGARRVDAAVGATYDDQVRRGLVAEVADLAARYDLDREYRRVGAGSPNQVLRTHGYREFFEVAAGRGQPVRRLGERDLAAVREQVLDHIRQYTRRQRSWFRKLPSARMVGSAQEALSVVTGGPARTGSGAR